MNRRALSATFVAAFTLAAATAPAVSQTVVLRGATVHPVSGPPIENGVVVVDGTRIQSVGGAGTAIPEGARVEDLSGRHLYPGFVQAFSALGLSEIDSIRATVDLGELGDLNSDLRAEVAFHADSIRLPPAVAGGVLTANVVPRGGLFAGTSAVMRLEGWNWEEMTVEAPSAMLLEFPAVGSGGGGEGEDQSKALEELDEIVERVEAYRDARAAGVEIDSDRKLERLIPVLTGELPLLVRASTIDQIEKALEWTEERGLENWILVSGADAAYAAEKLAERDVPVLVESVLSIPSRDFEPYDHHYTAPGRLDEAGVRFAVTGPPGSEMARNLPFEAAMAAAFGLDREVALRSVTLTPAEILGVEDRLGSIDPGKEATFFVSTGDPLEIVTSIERVWIAGQEVDLEAGHQRRLWRKYAGRPSR